MRSRFNSLSSKSVHAYVRSTGRLNIQVHPPEWIVQLPRLFNYNSFARYSPSPIFLRNNPRHKELSIKYAWLLFSRTKARCIIKITFAHSCSSSRHVRASVSTREKKKLVAIKIRSLRKSCDSSRYVG